MSYSHTSQYRRRNDRQQPGLLGQIVRAVVFLVLLVVAVKVGLFLIGTLLALGLGALMLVIALAPFIIAFWILWALFQAVFC